MSRMFEDLKETLKQELRALSKKEMTKESLDTMYKLTESLKAIQTIEAMEKSEEGSSSERGYSRYMPMGGYAMNDSYRSYEGGSNNRGSYEDNSNRRSYEGGGSNKGSYESYEGGGSNRGSYARRGRDGDNDGRYNETSGRYSRHTSKERMIEKLGMMMDEASSEKEREAIMRCMEQLES